MQKIYFTADPHLFHKNIIKYCNRPFQCVADMHKALREYWNMTVDPKGHVYILGDLYMKRSSTKEEVVKFLRSLNGKKYLIKGNHDQNLPPAVRAEFVWIKDYYELKIEDDTDPQQGVVKQEIIMSHYAFKVWARSHYGSWHVYGHSHGTLRDLPTSRSYDVGVDNNLFSPVSYLDLKKIMAKKRFVSLDHHISKEG